MVAGEHPTPPETAPTAVASTSIREKENVTIRATVAGITSVAAISVTPSTCILARIVAESTTITGVAQFVGTGWVDPGS